MDFGFEHLLKGVLSHIPIILVCIVGLFVALARWPKHPAISLATFLALGTMLAWHLVMSLYPFAIQLLVKYDLAQQMSWIMFAINIVGTVVNCAAMILLLWAVFALRPGRSPFAARG